MAGAFAVITVLKKPDGTPYDGTNSDNEGLAVLPDGEGLGPGDPVKVMVLDWDRVSTPS